MAGVPFFVRPLPFTVLASGNALGGNPALHLAEFQYVGMTWRSNGTSPALTVDIDFGSAQTIDFVGVLAANALPGTTFRIAMGASLANVQGATPTYDSTALTFIAPAVTGRALYNSHFELPAAQTYRYMRVTIAGHTGDFEAAFLVAGQKVQPARYYEPEWEVGPADLGTISLNRNSVPDIARGTILRNKSFTLGWLTEAEHETKFAPLAQAVGKIEPVFVCFDPEATTYRQGRTYFGRFTDNLRTRKRNYNRHERSFELLSMI